jgi:hypothetical protein
MRRPRAQVSLVNGIPTLSRFTIWLRESFHLQDESHCRKSSGVDRSLHVLAESVQPISTRSRLTTRR